MKNISWTVMESVKNITDSDGIGVYHLYSCTTNSALDVPRMELFRNTMNTKIYYSDQKWQSFTGIMSPGVLCLDQSGLQFPVPPEAEHAAFLGLGPAASPLAIGTDDAGERRRGGGGGPPCLRVAERAAARTKESGAREARGGRTPALRRLGGRRRRRLARAMRLRKWFVMDKNSYMLDLYKHQTHNISDKPTYKPVTVDLFPMTGVEFALVIGLPWQKSYIEKHNSSSLREMHLFWVQGASSSLRELHLFWFKHSSASAVAALQTCSNHVGMRASSEHKEDGSSPGSQAGHDARRSTGKVLCLEAAALRLEGDSVIRFPYVSALIGEGVSVSVHVSDTDTSLDSRIQENILSDPENPTRMIDEQLLVYYLVSTCSMCGQLALCIHDFTFLTPALYRGLEASNSTILDIDDQQPRFTHADWLGFALFRD
uniref:Uncharacterized protein n=1 Tax=Oryza rufipogon TaxID=4529 RepID=A0A0E0Q4V7_ORYRU